MDLKLARFNMVHQQVRPWDVSNKAILDLLSNIPREQFIPKSLRGLAYSDTLIPIGSNQVALSPKIAARILQAVDPKPQDNVLEIGTGTGYLTALLAHFAKKVISVEIFSDLKNQAQDNLNKLDIHNVELELGDGSHGFQSKAPYDIIVITGSVASIPHSFRKQIAKLGRLFAVVGKPPVMRAILLTRDSQDQFKEKVLFETLIPPLMREAKVSKFEL